ncbi:hypothetical protein H1S01_11790 [Heliobacterium chlorum]|uniref:Uncharacterized protein n=1 Tax=Heliobacterium chlorum TaxID=2698 RepID=A0ABR7T3G0_HELCL|nr:hypothetical protein [Heliobacterium chlorum]MBC9785191.1 hypothetical protein [Heliobacterium chlorum]
MTKKYVRIGSGSGSTTAEYQIDRDGAEYVVVREHNEISGQFKTNGRNDK